MTNSYQDHGIIHHKAVSCIIPPLRQSPVSLCLVPVSGTVLESSTGVLYSLPIICMLQHNINCVYCLSQTQLSLKVPRDCAVFLLHATRTVPVRCVYRYFLACKCR
jgi:hypothetical protein